VSKKSREKAAKAKREESEATPPSGWARLSKGTKALVALIGTTVVAAVVPGVLPYASDRVLDLFHSPIVDVDGSISATADGLRAAATETVTTAPADIDRDSRFVPAGYALTSLTLENKRAAKVSVLGATVEIEDRLPPRQGTLFSIPPQGATDNSVIDLDLDAPRPVLADPGNGHPYFVGKHIDLDRGEVWVVEIQSRTTRHEYSWRLHLQLRYRGANRELVVPPAGRPPFRMTAFVAPAAYRRQFVWDDKADLVARDCATARAACAATALPAVKAPG